MNNKIYLQEALELVRDAYKFLSPEEPAAHLISYADANIKAVLESYGKDTRVSSWHVICTFYQGNPNNGDLIATSDPEGDVIEGLPTLCDLVASYAYDVHEAVPDELTVDATKQRLKSLRPKLSRGKGETTFSIMYGEYTLRLDIKKVE